MGIEGETLDRKVAQRDLVLRAPKLVTLAGEIDDAWIAISDGRVSAVGSGRLPNILSPAPKQHCEGVLVPGFIDPHVHGADGYDFATASAEQARAIVDFLADNGSTSVMATVATGELSDTLAAIERLAPLVMDRTLLGIHLEGPYLSDTHRGAHRADLLREPVIAELDQLLSAGAGTIAEITIAPELPGAVAAIEHLVRQRVIVALGHTNCDAATAKVAVDAGARVVTHLFNGMRPLHHRNPGLVGVGLTDPRLTVELIVDDSHVDPIVVRLARAVVGSRLMLISDGIAATGAPDGKYQIGGSDVVVTGGTARLADLSSLAGSTTTLADSAVRLRADGASWRELVHCLTGAAASLLALPAPLAVGSPADLLVLDADARLHAVMKRGVWRRSG